MRLPGAQSALTACGDYLSTALSFTESPHLSFPLPRFLSARAGYVTLFREKIASSRRVLVGTGFAFILCMMCMANMAHIATM